MMDMREYMERQRHKRSMKKEAENQDTENQVTGNRKRDIPEAAGKKKIWENRKGRNENSKNWMHWMDKKRKRLNLCISLGICIMLILFQRGLTVQGQGLSEPTEKIAEEAGGGTEGLGEGEEQEVSGGTEVSLKESELYARSAVLMDGDSGRILFDKNGEEVLPMASTTKIMTCILALERSDPEDLCQVSELAAAQPKVHLGMRSGESYRMEDLLYSMMLESHNDSAVCVAEYVGGNVEGFARLMNRKAEEIGCTDTHYVTPNGLDGEDDGGTHATTAADLARVLRYCVTQSEQREKFCEITGTAQWNFTDASGMRSFTAVNHNTLFQLTDGVISGKTGFTGNAGYCYVGAVRQQGKLLIGALLACGWPNNRGYKWSDMKKLLKYGTEKFEVKQINLSDIRLPEVRVEKGNISHVKTMQDPERDGQTEISVLASAAEEPEYSLIMECRMEAPVRKGSLAGTLICRIGGWTAAEIPVAAAEDVERISWPFCLERIWKMLLL